MPEPEGTHSVSRLMRNTADALVRNASVGAKTMDTKCASGVTSRRCDPTVPSALSSSEAATAPRSPAASVVGPTKPGKEDRSARESSSSCFLSVRLVALGSESLKRKRF